MARIGLISDTHGLLRPQALAALAGCERILHAGDICGPEVLQALAAIAPVTAVRGNNDTGAWADALREVEHLQLAGVGVLMLHDLSQLPPLPAGVQVVVSGHSHKPLVDTRDGVLYVNPGSAGPRRFRLPIAVAELHIDAGGRVDARILELAP